MSKVGPFFASIFRTLLVSAIMIVISISIISGEFPPNFQRFNNVFENFNATKPPSDGLSASESNTGLESAANGMDPEDADVQRLEKINQLRGEMGAKLIPRRFLGQNSKTPDEGGAVSPPQTQEQLENKIRQLQQDLFRLQDRVNRMEAAQNKK